MLVKAMNIGFIKMTEIMSKGFEQIANKNQNSPNTSTQSTPCAQPLPDSEKMEGNQTQEQPLPTSDIIEGNLMNATGDEENQLDEPDVENMIPKIANSQRKT